MTDKVGEGDEAKLVTIPVAGHFLRRALGASTTDGGAWVDERIAKKDIAKPTSQRAYLDFVSKYLEAMKANPGNSGDDKEADSVDLSPKDSVHCGSPTEP